MWLVACPKRFDSLDIAEQRLNTHGLYRDNGYFERVYIGDIRQPGIAGNVRFYLESKTECYCTWIELLLGDVCEISAVDNIYDTVTIDQALRKITNERPE